MSLASGLAGGLARGLRFGSRGGGGDPLGPELVLNGDFAANGTSWTPSGTGTPDFSGQSFVFTGADGLLLFNDGTVEVGEEYQYSFEVVTEITAGFVQLLIGGAATGGVTEVGVYQDRITTTSNGFIIAQASGAGEIDNISVRKVM